MGDSWLPGTLPLLYPTPPKGQKKKEAKPGSSNSSIKHLTFHFPPSGVGGGEGQHPPPRVSLCPDCPSPHTRFLAKMATSQENTPFPLA